jgi:amino acid adenylation domain-containing protein
MVKEFSARDFVEQATARGIQFTVEDGHLRTRARRGAIDADMTALIHSNKQDIMDWVVDNAPPVAAERSRLVPRPNRTLAAPLSLAQERFWFIDRLTRLGEQYNLYGALRIRGDFDVEIARRALQCSIDRHETLRMVYRQEGEDGTLHQVPVSDTHLRMAVHDLREMHEPLREQRLSEFVHANASKPFDLSSDLMLRASLVRLRDDESVMLLCMPHIAADGWSMRVLEKEFVPWYVAMREGGEVQAPPLAITYGDYAVWQRDRMRDSETARQLAYWERTLRGAPSVHGLPLDRPRRSDSSHPAGRFGFMLDRTLYDALKTFAYEAKATIFMLMHAAFAIVLARNSGESDIVLGTPVMNRLEKPLEILFGCFVNTLVLRVQCGSNGTLRDFVDHVRDVNLDAQGNQEITFEQVVDRVRPERSMLHAPLFQIMFSMGMPRTGTARGVPGLDMTPLDYVATVAKFDLSLYAQDVGPDLFFGIEFDSDLFDISSVERLAKHFTYTLEQVTSQPDVELSSLQLAPTSQLREIAQTWGLGALREVPAGSVDEAFERQARARPQVAALVYEGVAYGYAELNERANRLAHALRLRGVGPEVAVGICLPRSADLAVAILAVWKAGGAYVPLDPDNPSARLRLMLEDAQATCVIGYEASLQGLEAAMPLALDTALLRAELEASVAQDPQRGDPTPSDRLAYILFTSGSSGRPKGVRVEHGSVMNLAAGLDAELAGIGVEGPQQWAWNASYGFDASLQALVQWRHGATLHLLSAELRRDPKQLREYLAKASIQVLDATPLQVEALLDVDGPALPSLVIGGEAIDARLWARITEHYSGRSAGALNAYGPTETTVDATVARIEGTVPRIGRPLANVRCLVLDSLGREQPEGVPGELYIGGAGVARGYAGLATETSERFVEVAGYTGRYYRSGDRVRWSRDGSLEYLGRLDGQVKIRGYRIEPEEVAQALRSEPGVASAAVVAREGTGGMRLVGYVVASAHTLVAAGWEDDLLERLRARLPGYMVPTALMRLDHLPITVNGKLDVRALPEEDKRRIGRMLPATPTEIIIAEIWSEVLDRPEIDVRDNFFALGGHSLMATRVAARIAEAFRVEVPLRVFFDSPTIRALAAYLEAEVGTNVADPIRPLDGQTQPVLSFAQQRIWFLERMRPGTASYNIPMALRVRGKLNVEWLRESVQATMDRHEVLRTTFVQQSGVPTPVVHAQMQLDVPVVDLSDLDIEARDAKLQRHIEADCKAPFDLENGPLLRLTILDLGDEDSVLLFCVHHIVADGGSMQVIKNELHARYKAKIAGSQLELAALAVQYGDYAAWQREKLDDELDNHRGYWTRHLEGVSEQQGLFHDHARGATHRDAANLSDGAFSASLREGLQRIGSEAGASLFMVCLTAFKVLLARCTGEDDIVVGMPVDGRSRRELEPMVGMFVNTLALRSDLSGDPTFGDLLGAVRTHVLEAFDHQEFPFEKLVDALGLARSADTVPLIRSMFSVVPGGSEGDANGGFEELPGIAAGPAKFDLTVILAEHANGLRAEVQYDPNLFEHATIERLMQRYRHLLEAIVETPSARISALSLLPDVERAQLETWGLGALREVPAGSVDEAFERQARARPQVAALVYEGVAYGYAELNERANRLAHALRLRGVGPEVAVGICLPRSADLAVAILAVWKAGGAYVPLDPDNPSARLRLMLEDAQATCVIGYEASLQGLEAAMPLALDTALLRAELEASVAQDPQRGDPTPSDRLAYILFTSGSSGRPKGVRVEHGSVMNLAAGLDAELAGIGVEGPQQWAWNASYGFDASLQALVQWRHGATLHLLSAELRRDPKQLREYLAKASIQVLDATPLQVEALLDVDGPALPSLVIGGEAIDARLWARITEHYSGRSAGALNAYGPTETTVDATVARIEGTVPRIGRPLANVRCLVLDSLGREQPEGVPGELYIGGAGVARGYAGLATETSERFVEVAGYTGRYYRSGDRVRWSRDGSLEYLGRLDGQVKIRGYRIEPEEVAQALRSEPGVASAAVVAREGTGGMRLVGYVVASAHTLVAAGWEDDLLERLRARLPGYMVPTALMRLDHLPITVNGKLDVRALPEEDKRRIGRMLPATPTEIIIAEIWSEVLDRPEIDVRDNFFALGGHSLMATRVAARIAEAFRVEVPLRVFFDSPTIRALAAYLEAEVGTNVANAMADVYLEVSAMETDQVLARLQDQQHE